MFKKKKQKSNTTAITRVKGSVGRVDIPFLILIFALLIFGLIMVASSSHVFALYKYGDSYHYIKRQLFFAIVGVVVMFVSAFFDYHKFRKYAFPLLIVAVFLLILVLIPIPGVSIKANGARRWLNFGVQFQPSEIGKFAIIVSFASYISANYKHMKKFKIIIVGILSMALLASCNKAKLISAAAFRPYNLYLTHLCTDLHIPVWRKVFFRSTPLHISVFIKRKNRFIVMEIGIMKKAHPFIRKYAVLFESR